MAGVPWTSAEDALLAELWPRTPILEDLVVQFPGRNYTAIRLHANRALGLTRSPAQKAAAISAKVAGELNGMHGKPGVFLGVKFSEEHKKNISEAARAGFASGRRPRLQGGLNPMFGRPSWNRGVELTSAVREKLSAKANSRWASRSLEWKQAKVQSLHTGLEKIGQGVRSSIELLVETWLQDLGVPYTAQASVDFYVVDFLIGTQVVECQGDYWHANPLMYGEERKPLNAVQRHNLRRDKAKKTLLESRGYSILPLWERDIKRNPELCKSRLAETLHV